VEDRFALIDRLRGTTNTAGDRRGRIASKMPASAPVTARGRLTPPEGVGAGFGKEQDRRTEGEE
jgi:hypothetical protein